MKKDFKFEGSKLIVTAEFDPNGDGQPVMKIAAEIDMAEIPDEVLDAVAKKKSEAKA